MSDGGTEPANDDGDAADDRDAPADRARVSVYDHLRAGPDDPIPAGVYRVVGADGDGATLLAVADGDGRRGNTGRIERVDAATVDALAPAGNPDTGLGRLRQVPKAYRAHSKTTAAAVAAVLVGLLARRNLVLDPDLGETLLIAGAAVLAVVALRALR